MVGGVHGQGGHFRDDQAGKHGCHVFRREAVQRQAGNHSRLGGLDLRVQILQDRLCNGFNSFVQLAFQPASGGHVVGRDQERAAVAMAHNVHGFRGHIRYVPVFGILDRLSYCLCNFDFQRHRGTRAKRNNFIRVIRCVTVQWRE